MTNLAFEIELVVAGLLFQAVTVGVIIIGSKKINANKNGPSAFGVGESGSLLKRNQIATQDDANHVYPADTVMVQERHYTESELLVGGDAYSAKQESIDVPTRVSKAPNTREADAMAAEIIRDYRAARSATAAAETTANATTKSGGNLGNKLRPPA